MKLSRVRVVLVVVARGAGAVVQDGAPEGKYERGSQVVHAEASAPALGFSVPAAQGEHSLVSEEAV